MTQSNLPDSHNAASAFRDQSGLEFSDDLDLTGILTPKGTADDTHSWSTGADSTHDTTYSAGVGRPDEHHHAICSPVTALPGDVTNDLVEKLLWDPGTGSFHDTGSSIIQVEGNDQYTGPSSGLSALSAPILSLARKSMVGFGELDFEMNIELCQASLLKIQQRVQKLSEMPMSFLSQLTTPLPPDEIAAEYVKAYFTTCQIIFPIVQRKSFERAWRENLDPSATMDISWYMLQNAILAMGAFTSKSASTPASYRHAKEEALSYFNNALNAHASLLPSQASLMAIQALCVMFMFTQQIGNRELAYRCLSFATKLAMRKGLHKMTANRSDVDSAHRNEKERVFWVLYFFDKIFALDAGLPSNIEDADVSCSFPGQKDMNPEEFSGRDIELLLQMARYAHICSKIRTRLYSATALNRDLKELLSVRDALCHDLSLWRDGIPPEYHAKKTPFRVSSLPPQVKPTRALLLRIAYQCALGNIHRRFSPLFLNHLRIEPDTSTPRQSDHEHLQAAREVILLLDQVEMDVDAPNWFFAYYLLTAVIPLVISVVTNPLDESAKDDIPLINLAAGIFGRLEFITAGDFAFEGVAELAQLAKLVVENAKRRLEFGFDNTPGMNGPDLHGIDPFSAEDFFQMQATDNGGNQSHNFIPGDLRALLSHW